MTQDNKIISESKTARTPKNKGFSNVLLKLFCLFFSFSRDDMFSEDS
jgi:hypothetical protein